MAIRRELSRNEVLIKNEISIPDYYNQVIVPQKPGFFAISEGKKAGICPFHDEKDPSFHYWSSKQFFHCFGCGVSGDVIFLHQKFMKEYAGTRMTRKEAIQQLAKLYHVELYPDDEEQDGEKESVFQKALRQLTDNSAYSVASDKFTYSKFMTMNTRLIGLSAPLNIKVDNFAELDMKVASYIVNAKKDLPATILTVINFVRVVQKYSTA